MTDQQKSDRQVSTINPALDLDSVEDIDAMLMRGVSVLRASGRLRFEDDALDQALVLDVLSAVMPASQNA